MASIQLLAISLRERTDVSTLLDTLCGDQRAIFDYLMDEVVTCQSPHIQDFLLRTSILARLNASCCDAVIGAPGSQEILEFLERANLFIIPLDQHRRWYRYHHLFAQALHTRLERTYTSDQIRNLHRRASYWLSTHGSPRELIPHALSAQEWNMAIDAMQIGHIYFHHVCSSQNATVKKWIEQLPTEILRQHPQLCLRYTILLTSQVHTTECEYWLYEVEQTVYAQGTKPLTMPVSVVEPQQKLLGEATLIRALCAVLRGEGDQAIPLCQQAALYCEAPNFIQRAQISFIRALAYRLYDQQMPAIQQFREALHFAETGDDTAIRAMIGSQTMHQLILQGQLRHAWELGQKISPSQESFFCIALLV